MRQIAHESLFQTFCILTRSLGRIGQTTHEASSVARDLQGSTPGLGPITSVMCQPNCAVVVTSQGINDRFISGLLLGYGQVKIRKIRKNS